MASVRRGMLWGLLLVLACGSPGEDAEPAAGAGDELPAPSAAPAGGREDAADLTAVTAAVSAPGGDAAFPHGEHLALGCRTCHPAPAGHGSHGQLSCDACHDLAPGTPVAPVAVAPDARCAACHHQQEAGDCLRCHDAAPSASRRSGVPVRGADPAPAGTAGMPFAHERHAGLACERCHGTAAEVDTRGLCSTCHARHHTPSASCTVCHGGSAAALDAHDPSRVHRGCGGAGCHEDAVVLALPATRELCLVCHPARSDHEPGGDCQACHRTRIGGGGRP